HSVPDRNPHRPSKNAERGPNVFLQIPGADVEPIEWPFRIILGAHPCDRNRGNKFGHVRPRNTQDIGRALNVAYVLEGSVRREAGRIHLNAQLIDTRTDAHVWAQEYDRDLSDVFTLQSEIAQRIADQLGTEVSAAEKAAIQEPPTTDLVAYDSYLRAKDLINGISWSTRAKEDLTQAVKLLDQAVTRDPLCFLAHGELAGAHDRIYFLGFDHTDARLKLSETAIQSVRRLRPESGETHLALAQHFYWAYADYDRAQSELVIAGRTLPNESRIPLLSASIDPR